MTQNGISTPGTLITGDHINSAQDPSGTQRLTHSSISLSMFLVLVTINTSMSVLLTCFPVIAYSVCSSWDSRVQIFREAGAEHNPKQLAVLELQSRPGAQTTTYCCRMLSGLSRKREGSIHSERTVVNLFTVGWAVHELGGLEAAEKRGLETQALQQNYTIKYSTRVAQIDDFHSG